ncbi:hypothetical protein SO802_005069 [Lithocarpus litseifolius]|uniref:Uncharacterized protein n=1 Tax=Lithocarpus litseifolius TaxID=425828 RepID=A0AAW2DLN8_9ROSI
MLSSSEVRALCPSISFLFAYLGASLEISRSFCPLVEDFIVTKHPRLKSRYKDRVEAAVKHAKTIDDFDDLVDPWTLAHHCLGPEPSAFVLRTLAIEEKKMTTKFNQDMYVKMRAKKNEPFFALGKRGVHVVD